MAGWFVQVVRPLTFDEMQQSKLLELLRRLDRRQLARVGEAVLSPFFNKNEDIARFYQHLLRFAPTFNQPELAKVIVLNNLKLAKPLDERRLQYLMSDLVALVENVLAIDRLECDEPARLILLAQTLAEVDLPDRARQTLGRIADFFGKNQSWSADRLEQSFAVAKLEFFLSDATRRAFEPTLQTANDQLTEFFLSEKLRLLTAIANHEQMFIVQYRHGWEDALLDHIGDEYKHPLLRLWLFAYRLTCHDLVDDFQALKDLLMTEASLLVKTDVIALTTIALNFCTRRINRDADERFYGEYLDLYKLLIDHNFILKNEQISPSLYQNLVTVGLKTEDLPWTRQFIEKFHSHLPEESAESMYAYNLGHLFYHEKKYKDAQQALARVEFRDPLLSISARSLLIKIYVETDQDDLLFAALEAARVWLLRNQAVTAGLRRQFQKFVEMTGKMARLLPKDHAGATLLLEKLPPPTEVLHRDWLAAQLKQR
ncbi:MAG: hypothetical protein Q7T20_00025 [Saprospiraceae bacterium]|nr:hypothetical protein [Saprospiraceae bacterium]